MFMTISVTEVSGQTIDGEHGVLINTDNIEIIVPYFQDQVDKGFDGCTIHMRSGAILETTKTMNQLQKSIKKEKEQCVVSL